jgi:TonB-dependent receptor
MSTILCGMAAARAAAQDVTPDAGVAAPVEAVADGGAAPADAGAPPAEDAAPDAATALPTAPPPLSAPPVVDAPQAPVEAPLPKGSGTLIGTVKGAEDGMSIEGANVYVRGEPYQAHTDADGKYRLDLPSGNYQITVIYPGFSTQTVSKVEVRPGRPSKLDVDLRVGSEVLDEFVITGSRVEGGIATLIAERRESSAVADVIGSEQMARSGDANAAAALARVTGITVIDGKWVLVRGMGERYSTMTLNQLQVPSPDPTRRVVPLDLFPAGVIESVVVQKTYSPDLPGEFGGGLVQLRSRDYPDKFLLSVNVATGGNTNSTFKQRLTYRGGDYDLFGVDDGTRGLPSAFSDPRGKLVLPSIDNPDAGYSAEELEQLGEKLPNIYNTKREQTYPDLTMVANVGDSYRLRRAKIGFVAAAGYKNEYRSIDDAINRVYLPNRDMPEQNYLLDTDRRQISLSGFLDWGVEFSQHQKLKATTMLLRQTDDTTQFRDDIQAGGTRTTLSWVERQVLLQQVSGFHKFERAHNFQVDWRYAFGQAIRLEPDRRQYFYVPNAETDELELATGGASNQRLYGDMTDDTHEAALDLSQPFDIWKRLEAKVKAGALFYKRDRVADTRRFSFAVIDRSMVDLTLDPERIFTPEHIGPALDFQETTLNTDSYDALMQIEAGYAMLQLPIVKSLDVMAGARLEHARIQASTFDAFDDQLPPTTSKLDNLDVLPAATITWRFAEDFQLRGGYSRTLNRPDLREVSTSRYYDLDTNLQYTGNPEVKRALIDNVDARIEWYYTPDEVFSIGAFMKDFTDPIETYNIASSEEIFSVKNADHARSYGFEIEGRKRFGFVAKALDPLYLASNLSLIDSTVDITLEGTKYERPLQGQSPWVINVQLGWDGSGEGGTGTSAALMFNSAGRRIRVIGDPTMEQGDLYELPIHRMDLVVSQDLPRGFKLGARARNLLNPKETWVRDGQIWREQRRGADLQLSVSWAY